MLTLSPVARRRVLAGVAAVALFAGGIGATRVWDAVQVHQAQHAAWPTMATAINILLAEVPAARAAFQQVVGSVSALPTLPALTEAATPDAVEDAEDTEDTDDGSDPS